MLGGLHGELLLRIAIGTLLGAAIGFERDLHGRPAGLRTHALVALASATFMVISTRFVFFQRYTGSDLVETDPSRIAASVVSGIGFLGAGAILRTGITVRGLTTAATLWLVSAIGMAAGGGMYMVALFTTLLGLVTLTLFRKLEDRGDQAARQRVTVTIAGAEHSTVAVAEALQVPGAIVSEEEYEHQRESGHVRIAYTIRAPGPVRSDEIARALDRLPGIIHVKIDHL